MAEEKNIVPKKTPSKDVQSGEIKESGDKKEEVKESEDKKDKKKKVSKKDLAIARGISLKISPKHSFAICKVIKRKSPENAIKRLDAVVNMKRAIPMAGLEVAHQHGKGLAGAKFPRNACLEIIKVIKQAEANSVVAGIENPIITIAKANRASAPYRRAGRKAKRTHIYLEVKDSIKNALSKNNKKSKASKKRKSKFKEAKK
tara:strand:- start:9533 stop:10138 length:606 start_codon:yes stop_codon:yes gene_type:complete